MGVGGGGGRDAVQFADESDNFSTHFFDVVPSLFL